ncbi:MAG: hypothetical protein U9P90_04050 [Patescibacteria group bacterium]|nr:hypothetical protein [Patescibacteria group bacterium]
MDSREMVKTACFLAEATTFGGEEATLRRERRDREEFVDDKVSTGGKFRTQIPAKMEPEGAREALERAGVKFHEGKPAANILFDWVVLPPDWKKVPTSHPWLTMLVDNHGRERARLFYKAADRNAMLIYQPRYGLLESDFGLEVLKGEGLISIAVADGCAVLDDGELVYCTEALRASGKKERFRIHRELVKTAKTWLDANYPNWEDPFAYWED